MPENYLDRAILWCLRTAAPITASGLSVAIKRPASSIETALERLEAAGKVARCGKWWTPWKRLATAWRAC